MNKPYDEILKDDHPVYRGFHYVADGTIIESDFRGVVRDLKKITGAKVIKLHNVYGGRSK